MDHYNRGWLWVKPPSFDKYLEEKIRDLEGVYSAWGLADPAAHYLAWIAQTGYPMVSTFVRSLLPGDARKATKRWPLLRFHGWQFSRYNKKKRHALAYFSYTPDHKETEGDKNPPVREYTPCRLREIVTHGLSNCGFSHGILTDDLKLTVNRKNSYPCKSEWLSFQSNMQVREANKDIRKYCNKIDKAAVLDIIVHPSRLVWLKKIRKGPRIQIIIEAHLSRITGHACIRLLVGAESWKTWKQIEKRSVEPDRGGE